MKRIINRNEWIQNWRISVSKSMLKFVDILSRGDGIVEDQDEK